MWFNKTTNPIRSKVKGVGSRKYFNEATGVETRENLELCIAVGRDGQCSSPRGRGPGKKYCLHHARAIKQSKGLGLSVNDILGIRTQTNEH